jgi:zinc transporter 1/2/3
VSTGASFPTLLVAICFHQLFEGLALGSTIAQAGYGRIKSLMLGGVYALTTPLGIGIGIALHASWSDTDQTSLVVQGVFDALSAGILIYTAIAEFLTGSINRCDEFGEQSAWRQVAQFGKTYTFLNLVCLYLGCASMAIVGLWA